LGVNKGGQGVRGRSRNSLEASGVVFWWVKNLRKTDHVKTVGERLRVFRMGPDVGKKTPAPLNWT